jgi:ubiquinone/menaquinone biosynthesis C-methylase UbiE
MSDANARRLNRFGRLWDELADVDPLWAILTTPGKQYGRWQLAEFFRTGQEEIDAVLAVASKLSRPRRWNRTLDFGCGVGRTTRALAKHFDHCHGVDISAGMIRQARDLNRDCPRCFFSVSSEADLRGFRSRSFDLVYSSFVLQHLPSRDCAIDYIREFMRVARLEGLVVLQVPDRLSLLQRVQLRPRLYTTLRALGAPSELLYSRLRLHPMRMMALAETDVRQAVQASGGAVLEATTVDENNQLAGLRYYIQPGALEGSG